MADNTRVFKDTVGLKLEFSVNVDVDDVTSAELYMLKPNGKKAKFDCDIDNDNQVIYYTTEDGDLDVVGLYKMQLKVKLNDDEYEGFSEPVKMMVEDTLG